MDKEKSASKNNKYFFETISVLFYGFVGILSFLCGFLTEIDSFHNFIGSLKQVDWVFLSYVGLCSSVFNVLYRIEKDRNNLQKANEEDQIRSEKKQKIFKYFILLIATAYPFLVFFSKNRFAYNFQYSVWIPYFAIWTTFIFYRADLCSEWKQKNWLTECEACSEVEYQNYYKEKWYRSRYALILPSLFTIALNMYTGFSCNSDERILSIKFLTRIFVYIGLVLYVFFIVENVSDPINIYMKANKRSLKNSASLGGPNQISSDIVLDMKSSPTEERAMNIDCSFTRSTEVYTKINFIFILCFTLVCFAILVISLSVSYQHSAFYKLKESIFSVFNAIIVSLYIAIFESWRVLANFKARNIDKLRRTYETEKEEYIAKDLAHFEKEFLCYINVVTSLLVLFPPIIFIIWPFTTFGITYIVIFSFLSIVVEFIWMSSNMVQISSWDNPSKVNLLRVLRIIIVIAVLSGLLLDKFHPLLQSLIIPLPNISMNGNTEFLTAGITAAIAFLGWVGIKPIIEKESSDKCDNAQKIQEDNNSIILTPILKIDKQHNVLEYLLCQIFWLLLSLATLLLFSELSIFNWEGWREMLSQRIQIAIQLLCLMTWIITLLILFLKYHILKTKNDG